MWDWKVKILFSSVLVKPVFECYISIYLSFSESAIELKKHSLIHHLCEVSSTHFPQELIAQWYTKLKYLYFNIMAKPFKHLAYDSHWIQYSI